MKRPPCAWLRAQASRLLMHATARLLGDARAAWARAMQAEVAAIGDEREALAFAWGCFSTATGLAWAAGLAGMAQARNAGVLACAAAVLLGCAFMHSAGAPSHYAVMNLLSLAFALATFRLLPRQRLAQDDRLRARLSFALGATLLAVSLSLASVGVGAGATSVATSGATAGASAWLTLGPVHLNLLWLLLPALLVASDGHPLSTACPWALAGLLMACTALALLAEPWLAGVVAAVLGLRAWRHRSGALALLAGMAGATALHFGPSWQLPQALPFVDRVLHSGFAHSPALGLALALLQLLPLWPALRDRQARQHGLVWGLLVLLSLPGWLPSPLLGFGGSFIVGYLLSLALLPGGTAPLPPAGPAPAPAHPRPRPPSWPRSGLT